MCLLDLPALERVAGTSSSEHVAATPVEFLKSRVADKHSVEATHYPCNNDNDNDQAENTAETGPAIAITSVVTTTTARQPIKNDNQN